MDRIGMVCLACIRKGNKDKQIDKQNDVLCTHSYKTDNMSIINI